MARVTLAQSAQTDLVEAWLFIAEDNQQAADRVLDTIDKDPYAFTSAADGSSTSRTG